MEGEIYRSIEEILETGPWTKDEQDQLEEFFQATSSLAQPQTYDSDEDWDEEDDGGE